MKGLPKLSALLVGLLLTGLGAAVQYDDFEDFLKVVETERGRGGPPTMPGARLKTRLQTAGMLQGPGWDDEDSDAETSGDDADRPQSRATGHSRNPVFRGDQPVRRVSCCDFGRLAGSGGYHCNPDFYKPQIWFRLRNQFEMKQEMTGKRRGRKSGRLPLTSQFRKCMNGKRMAKNAFHKCCKDARMETMQTQMHKIQWYI
ncbi:Hypp5056 [Branchiostoma lanceolatum]|uniref:Hypp5056 protein n=1 Tax=Branchiostoma lanceolatum TaxID=7740 RepID=A0A8K0F2Z3_BRALA|nr:Hypp5056 [Branchiostoma lanceolatum]